MNQIENIVNKLIEAEPEFKGKLYWDNKGLHIQGSNCL